MTIHWLSTARMTVLVEAHNGVITRTPPIVRKFMGQPVDNLRRWLSRQPGFREETLGGQR